MSITQSHMQNSSRPRLSHSPEKLILNKTSYYPDSDCARTFFILGEVVVWSHAYHIQIISCFRRMKNEHDKEMLKEYGVNLVGKLKPEVFNQFRESLTGELGTDRRANKAGRLWKNVIDEDRTRISVISFWAYQPTINDHAISLLQKAFRLKTPTWVDYEQEKISTLYPPQA